jgi:hypothetical protein
MRSSAHLMASFPASLQPPEPLVRYFRWLESQGLDRKNRYSLIDPSQSDSHIGIIPAETWGDAPADRLAIFCRTGGDGSKAALWRDDAGEIRFVHLGSGSGSVMVGVLAWNAVDFLRLLAIGYEELCWPDDLACTPIQAFENNNGEPDDWDEGAKPPTVPRALRQWLAQEFDVDIPETAAELVGTLPSYGDTNSTDPFCQWLAELQEW